MKSLILAAVAALAFATDGLAAEVRVARSTLDDMGLGSMQPLPEAEAQAVRGKGTFSNVWGGSVANWSGQSSFNSYSAGSSWFGKGSSAGGNTTSFGGNFQFSHFSW